MTSLSPLALAALERARASAATDKPISSRRNWSADQEQLLTQLYPDTPMPELIKRLGFTASAIYQKARNLGLRRSPEYLASDHACRLRKGDNVGAEYRFKAGQQPWNAGMHGWQAGGRSAETRFKPGTINGSAAERLKPVGFERVTGSDGIDRCGLVLAPEVVRTVAAPRRPFQGWRYLEPADAPPDLPEGRQREEPLPADLAQALAEIGLR